MIANQIIIIERRTGRLPDGLVPHDLQVDGEIVLADLSFLNARKVALDYIGPDTVVIERYESTGREKRAVGNLVNGRIAEFGE